MTGARTGRRRLLRRSSERIPEARLVKNGPPHGFGRAITCGLQQMSGDAVVIMMADESDDCRDVVRYWNALNEGWDAVFGSRFMKGGGVIDYPWLKLCLNRMANLFIRLLVRHFAERHHKRIQGLPAHRHRRLPAVAFGALQPHSGNSVEGHRSRLLLDVMPITWRNRRTGVAKLKIQGDGQPLSVHLSLPMAGKVPQPRRLQEGSCMSAPHSLVELQRLYEKRFAGKSEYRDKVWRVLVDECFVRWLPARPLCWIWAADTASSSTTSGRKNASAWTSIRIPSSKRRQVFDSGAELLATLGHAGRVVGRCIYQQFLRTSVHEARPS